MYALWTMPHGESSGKQRTGMTFKESSDGSIVVFRLLQLLHAQCTVVKNSTTEHEPLLWEFRAGFTDGVA